MTYLRLLFILVIVAFFSLAVFAQSDISGFSGNWSLDRERTKVDRDFPQTLKDFRMVISSDQEKLIVKAQVIGPVEPRINSQGSAPGASLSTQGSRTTTASPNGVMATGGAVEAEAPTQAAYGGTLAIFFTPKEITYDLTGKELKVEPSPGDRVNGTTRIRAKVGKDGRSVELTVIRKMKGPHGEAEITTRENWKLSEDGKTLQFHRMVQTPNARDNIDMTLARQG